MSSFTNCQDHLSCIFLYNHPAVNYNKLNFLRNVTFSKVRKLSYCRLYGEKLSKLSRSTTFSKLSWLFYRHLLYVNFYKLSRSFCRRLQKHTIFSKLSRSFYRHHTASYYDMSILKNCQGHPSCIFLHKCHF